MLVVMGRKEKEPSTRGAIWVARERPPLIFDLHGRFSLERQQEAEKEAGVHFVSANTVVVIVVLRYSWSFYLRLFVYSIYHRKPQFNKPPALEPAEP